MYLLPLIVPKPPELFDHLPRSGPGAALHVREDVVRRALGEPDALRPAHLVRELAPAAGELTHDGPDRDFVVVARTAAEGAAHPRDRDEDARGLHAGIRQAGGPAPLRAA